ncbi:MAG: cobalamin biosynthesis protein CobQ [Patescibacteria group bacterium]
MKYTLTIGWLYPELMSTYGDRGNIMVLQKRCIWRDIEVTILPITKETTDTQLQSIDLLFGGGAQDRAQEMVMDDLRKRGKVIKKLIEQDVPALFVCGAPQLMGTYYEPAEGKRIEGLGIFDMVSKHPGTKAERLIGNLVAEINIDVIARSQKTTKQSLKKIAVSSFDTVRTSRNDVIVGFENHGGRTYLGENTKPFAKVIKGFGNNGKDGTEGVVYKNAIGCYLHGPLLPKNPGLADYLITQALEVKYKEEITLAPLDDSLEKKAQEMILQKLGIRLKV